MHSFLCVIIGLIFLTIIASAITSAYPSTIIGLFPTSVRYTGVALTYNLGFAVAGGVTPLLVTWLIHITGNSLIPSVCIMLSAALAWLVCFKLRETSGMDLAKLTKE